MLEFFKFLGIFISFVSGVLATAFDTKDEKSKGLNQKGKILLTCIILGSFVSAITQYLDDCQQNREQKEAETQSSNNLERLSFIINDTERLAHPLEPLTWSAVVRYRLDTNSPLWSYVERIHNEKPDLMGFDLVDDLRPRRADPREASAWNCLMQPPVYVGVLNRDLFKRYKDRPVAVMSDLPLRLEASEHADPDGTWEAGPNATAPSFYSRIDFEVEGKTNWLRQEFVVRSSPESVHANGVISPIDLSGFLVVAESPRFSYSEVDAIVFAFPTASKDVTVKMKEVESPLSSVESRSVGVIETNSIQNALNLPLNPTQ